MKVKLKRNGFSPKGKSNSHMKIMVISDTHGERFARKFNAYVHEHGRRWIDILIYAGDFTKHKEDAIQKANFKNGIYDYDKQSKSFRILSEEMKKIKYCSHKFLVLGNHDVPYTFTGYDARRIEAIIGGGVRVLNNEHADIDYKGHRVRIYGSSYSGEDVNIWNKIPLDTNILCTHVPPKGYFDDKYKKGPAIKSSEALRNKINSMSIPLVCCGHNHHYEGDVKWNGSIGSQSCVFCAGKLSKCSKHLVYLRVTNTEIPKPKKKKKEKKKKKKRK